MNHNRHFSEWLADSDPDYHTPQELYYKLENKDGYMRSFGVDIGKQRWGRCDGRRTFPAYSPFKNVKLECN